MRRIDETGFGDLKLIQDTDAFCYGIDAVLLADFAARGSCTKPGRLLDMGAGNGIVPMILSHKMPETSMTGVEIQKEQAKIASENIVMNGLSDRIQIIHSDIKDISCGELGLFDMVTCNPPYFKRGAGMVSGNTAKMTARHETTATIDDFLRKASEMLKEGGQAAFVYRPGRLTDLLSEGIKADLYPSELQFVHPFIEKKANIVLVRFIKGKKSEMQVLPAIAVREASGCYTEKINEIYERNKKAK